MVNPVTIRVPATTSNLGAGFDCLGVALEVYNHIRVERLQRRSSPERHPMVREAAARFFGEAGRRAFPFAWEIGGDVPMARGLGSSVTLRLGVLMGLNVLAGSPLRRRELFTLCAGLEGHPDNAAPATYGGFTACDPAGAEPLRVPVAKTLHFVLLVPDFEIRTAEARALLPELVDRRAAVRSSGRACRVSAAFALKRYAALRGMFADEAFHQPYRTPLLPMLPAVLAAAEKTGALGGFLSGSGSTICCLSLRAPRRVATAMLAAAASPGARVIITRADNRGVVVSR